MSHNEATEYTVATSTHDAGYFSTLAPPARWRTDESDLHSSDPAESEERMLLSFQRPSRLLGGPRGLHGAGRAGGRTHPNGLMQISALALRPKGRRGEDGSECLRGEAFGDDVRRADAASHGVEPQELVAGRC